MDTDHAILETTSDQPECKKLWSLNKQYWSDIPTTVSDIVIKLGIVGVVTRVAPNWMPMCGLQRHRRFFPRSRKVFGGSEHVHVHCIFSSPVHKHRFFGARAVVKLGCCEASFSHCTTAFSKSRECSSFTTEVNRFFSFFVSFSSRRREGSCRNSLTNVCQNRNIKAIPELSCSNSSKVRISCKYSLNWLVLSSTIDYEDYIS